MPGPTEANPAVGPLAQPQAKIPQTQETGNFLRVFSVFWSVREAILETAQRYFLQQGFRATTMDQIAEALGISKKTLYEHFPSKEALFEASADAFLQQVAQDFEALRQAHASHVLLRISAIASYLYGLLGRINPILFTELRRLISHHRTRIVARIQELIHAHLTRTLQEGKAQGIFRPDLPPETFLTRWVSSVMLNVVLNPSFAEETGYSVAESYAETLLLLLNSFCSEEGRTQLQAYYPPIRRAYERK